MAIGFTLIRPIDGMRAAASYGFSWTTLALGPLEMIRRTDLGFPLGILLADYAASVALYFLYDHSVGALAVRLVAGNVCAALVYNEMQTLRRLSRGYELLGPRHLIEPLAAKFPREGRSGRLRLLYERWLVLIVFSIGVAQIHYQLWDLSLLTNLFTGPPAKSSMQPLPTATVPPFGTTGTLDPAAKGKTAEILRPPSSPSSGPTPSKQSSPEPVPTAAPGVMPAPILAPTATPNVSPTRGTVAPVPSVLLEESRRQCDTLMGTQFDSDLPKDVVPLVSTSLQSDDAIDSAIANCERARVGGHRRYSNQLGRALAARATLFASAGRETEARDFMNRAVQSWKRAAGEGSGSAMNFLGAYYNGTFNSGAKGGVDFVPPDYLKALEQWEKGSNLGNARAARNAAVVYLYGAEQYPPVTQDIGRAITQFERAIKAGDLSASAIYGESLYLGDPKQLKRDPAKGLTYLTSACQGGDPRAKGFFDKSRKPPVARPPNC